VQDRRDRQEHKDGSWSLRKWWRACILGKTEALAFSILIISKAIKHIHINRYLFHPHISHAHAAWQEGSECQSGGIKVRIESTREPQWLGDEPEMDGAVVSALDASIPR